MHVTQAYHEIDRVFPAYAGKADVKASSVQKPETWLIHPQIQVKPDLGMMVMVASKRKMGIWREGNRECSNVALSWKSLWSVYSGYRILPAPSHWSDGEHVSAN